MNHFILLCENAIPQIVIWHLALALTTHCGGILREYLSFDSPLNGFLIALVTKGPLLSRADTERNQVRSASALGMSYQGEAPGPSLGLYMTWYV